MKLSTAQINWLDVARVAGYERGFVHLPSPTLKALETLGLITRNPTTTGKRTLWRITGQGLEYSALMYKEQSEARREEKAEAWRKKRTS